MTKFANIQIPNWNRVREYLTLSEAEQISNFGPCYRLLTEKLKDYLQLSEDKEIIIVSSGHTAIQAALFAVDAKRTLVPDYTFASTLQAANLFTGNQSESQVVDVNSTGYFDWEILRNSMELDVDTILAVCPISNIPNLQELQRWCAYTNKQLVIDGAATFGTPGIYNYGTAFCLSFHATKSFPIGECGAVIINRELAPIVRSYINFGFDDTRTIVNHGLNGKVSDYTCAVGLALLEELEPSLQKRRNNAELFRLNLPNDIWFFPDMGMDIQPKDVVYQTFPIYTSNAAVLRNVLLQNGFEVKQYYKPLIGWPNARKLYDSNICLPCHPGVTKEEVLNMCNLIQEYI